MLGEGGSGLFSGAVPLLSQACLGSGELSCCSLDHGSGPRGPWLERGRWKGRSQSGLLGKYRKAYI